MQVTNAESFFTLPIASDVGAGTCSTDANWCAIVTNTIQIKRNKRTTAVLAVSRRVGAALTDAVPDEPPEPAEKGKRRHQTLRYRSRAGAIRAGRQLRVNRLTKLTPDRRPRLTP